MAPENPTVEMLVKVMGSELSMIGMGDVAAENTGHIWIVLQWSDQIHQPHAIGWNRVLGDESDVLASRQLHSQVSGATVAEIFFANPVQAESLVLWQWFKASIAGSTVDQQHFKGVIEILSQTGLDDGFKAFASVVNGDHHRHQGTDSMVCSDVAVVGAWMTVTLNEGFNQFVGAIPGELFGGGESCLAVFLNDGIIQQAT